MNIVRLGMIVTLGAVAYYALSIYAGLPAGDVVVAPTLVRQDISYMCPAISNGGGGFGVVLIALTALGGAIVVAAVDLKRRVY